MATTTAAQQRARDKVEYDAFLAGCPSRQLLDRISDKWVTLVLAALGFGGSHRFGADCAGEPRPMRYSELDGLVTRSAMATAPVTVTYELTDLGLSLHQTMRGIKSWAETHMGDVLANREKHDAAAA